MAKYRQVHVEFWQDGFVLDLTPEEKYFYLYLMTNSKTSQCGIYELPKRIMETETGYNRETVDKLIHRFEEYGKISYHEPTREIMILNWTKFNWINSPKVTSLIKKELENVKYQGFVQLFITKCKEYGYGIDTVGIDLGEEREIEIEREVEEEREEEVKNIPFSEIIDYLNSSAGKKYKSSTNKTKTCIKARWNEGFRLDDFKKVIDTKTTEWKTDSKMSQYLRPETLFGNKFEGYLNQQTKPKTDDPYDQLF
ncbi:conserved phage C-terminal domain-containing protein [Oceanobacillus kimchii]|uniref:conserved phage C-terminal domain-containing protein n=1 Tax=Oceanobacillus kimchii TaxID=746691 RepID=UPI0021A8BE90|nr:conserved phage C-terminal domain-containing protein [Oceanobacillus kimchii]MCT1575667.1 conserved phage C-terminal domain-containing protein [Oceanobacillus kimchii]MCT2137298.1 conserved phage C-terminal domain-containing protein [Oceanobacillus kimchii]